VVVLQLGLEASRQASQDFAGLLVVLALEGRRCLEEA